MEAGAWSPVSELQQEKEHEAGKRFLARRR